VCRVGIVVSANVAVFRQRATFFSDAMPSALPNRCCMIQTDTVGYGASRFASN
jgi:hypothetical protein